MVCLVFLGFLCLACTFANARILKCYQLHKFLSDNKDQETASFLRVNVDFAHFDFTTFNSFRHPRTLCSYVLVNIFKSNFPGFEEGKKKHAYWQCFAE